MIHSKYAIGKFVSKGSTLWSRYDYGSFTILVSAQALNKYDFYIPEHRTVN